MSMDWTAQQTEHVDRLLRKDAERIEKLIEVQLLNINTRKCPLYEEVLDTQMYGFSRVIDFNVRAGLLDEKVGKLILQHLEHNLAHLYEAIERASKLESQ